MKEFSYLALMVSVVGILLSGCDSGNNPVEILPAEKWFRAVPGI
jgi:hypothetical protein